MTDQRSSGDILADRRYRYAEACLTEGDLPACAEVAEQALALAPRYAPAWLLLGRARAGLYRATGDPAWRAAALSALRSALALDPDDALGARVELAGLGAGGPDGASPALSPAYVRALFEAYAPRFEAHLGELGYAGPALLAAALPAGARFARALDLGCGTGLVGRAVRGRVEHLCGVDLSPAMLARASMAGGYDRLVEADLGAHLAAEPAGALDLCLAADVFIYVADLAGALAGIARALRPGGLAAFTVQSPRASGGDEDDPGGGVALGADGRYAHADAAVAAAAARAGLEMLTRRAAVIRREGGRPVRGRVVVLRRG